jgi:PD-(D/E)XK endonuclease
VIGSLRPNRPFSPGPSRTLPLSCNVVRTDNYHSPVLTTDQKGAIAKAAITAAAVKLGVDVYRPVLPGRCDLIFDVAGRLLRIQCKWAARDGSVVIVRCYSTRRTRDGFVKRPYTAEEVDAIVAYCPDLDRCFFLPPSLFANKPYIQLRLSPTRNNQERGVHWANLYAFEAKLGGQGAIAQLGERRAGSAKVTGSSPVGSISDPLQPR